jgi:hypothetical protein
MFTVLDLARHSSISMAGAGQDDLNPGDIALSPNASYLAFASSVSGPAIVQMRVVRVRPHGSLSRAKAITVTGGFLETPLWTTAGLFGVLTTGSSGTTQTNSLVAIDLTKGSTSRTSVVLPRTLAGITAWSVGRGSVIAALSVGELNIEYVGTVRPSTRLPVPTLTAVGF